jgi:TRAP-type C4-dicarboxylate transport system permease small subunit
MNKIAVPKGRFRVWLEENRLVPDPSKMHGSSAIAEILRVANHWAHKLLLYIAQVALALMVVLVIMTVTLRYVFRTGIGWAEEVPVLLVTLFAFLATAIGVRDHMHISMNVFYNIFPSGGKTRKVLDFLSDLCVLVCGLFMLFYGWRYAARLAVLPGVLPMTGWPTFIQYLPAPMAGFVIAFDQLLFMTGVLDPDDLLYSEKEVDWNEVVKEQRQEALAGHTIEGGDLS